MSLVVASPMVAEVVAHSTDCLLLAIGRHSLDSVQRCALSATAAVTSAHYDSSSFSSGKEWTSVLRTLINTAAPKALGFLQRLHSGRHFGPEEHACSTALVNLLFLSATLCTRMEPKSSTLRRALGELFASYLSFMAYCAEQQLWHLKAVCTMPSEMPPPPPLHCIPQVASLLSDRDGWIWLFVECTTGPMQLDTISLVTQAIMEMDLLDARNAPFARVVVATLTSAYGHFLRHTATGSIVTQIDALADMCTVLRDLAVSIPVAFARPVPLLRLLRVTSQLYVVRLSIAASNNVHSTSAMTSVVDLSHLSLESAALLDVTAARLLENVADVPSDTSTPLLRVALLDLAAQALEVPKYEESHLCTKRSVVILSAARTLRSDADVAFAQSFVLALGEAISCMLPDPLSPPTNWPNSRCFVGAVQTALSKISESLSPEVFSGLEHIVELHLSTTAEEFTGNKRSDMCTETGMREDDNTSLFPAHRKHWLLAVSYLRMADMEAQLRQARGMPLPPTSENGILWSCRQTETSCWLRGEEPKCDVLAKTLRGRLISESMRLLSMALREAVEFESLAEKDPLHVPFHSGKPNERQQEASQAAVYATSFTRFLLMMEDVPAVEITKCADMCKSVIAESHGSVGTDANSCIGDADVDAARCYQLAVSLFVI